MLRRNNDRAKIAMEAGVGICTLTEALIGMNYQDIPEELRSEGEGFACWLLTTGWQNVFGCAFGSWARAAGIHNLSMDDLTAIAAQILQGDARLDTDYFEYLREEAQSQGE